LPFCFDRDIITPAQFKKYDCTKMNEKRGGSLA
jgi:hypothetical protein